MSTKPITLHAHADPRSLRETLVELCQTEDYDGFVQMALVQLDLMFEQDPAARTKLQMMEQILKEVDEMDWPRPPALTMNKARLLSLEAVFRDNAELANGDFPSKVRPLDGAGRTTGARPSPLLLQDPGPPVARNGKPSLGSGRATGTRPLPLIPRNSDPRATGSGPV